MHFWVCGEQLSFTAFFLGGGSGDAIFGPLTGSIANSEKACT